MTPTDLDRLARLRRAQDPRRYGPPAGRDDRPRLYIYDRAPDGADHDAPRPSGNANARRGVVIIDSDPDGDVGDGA